MFSQPFLHFSKDSSSRMKKNSLGRFLKRQMSLSTTMTITIWRKGLSSQRNGAWWPYFSITLVEAQLCLDFCDHHGLYFQNHMFILPV